jgi:drug/metabolite transporter (DMT)-like permease
MSLAKFGGLALAFAGVVLVFSDKLSLPDPEAIVGDVMSLGGGLFWAATTLVIKRSRLVTASAEKLLLYQLSVSAVMALPMLLFAGPVFREVTFVPTAALLFQAIYVVAVTYVLWFWLMRRYPASGLSSFTFLTPVFGVLCGGLILNEPLSIRIFLALALIGAGLIIVNRPQRQRA